jgi:hypothetical protein
MDDFVMDFDLWIVKFMLCTTAVWPPIGSEVRVLFYESF